MDIGHDWDRLRPGFQSCEWHKDVEIQGVQLILFSCRSQEITTRGNK